MLNRQQMESHLALLGWAPVRKCDHQSRADFLLTPDKGRVVWVTGGAVYAIPRVSRIEEFTAGSWQDWQPSELEAVIRRLAGEWPC